MRHRTLNLHMPDTAGLSRRTAHFFFCLASYIACTLRLPWMRYQGSNHTSTAEIGPPLFWHLTVC